MIVESKELGVLVFQEAAQLQLLDRRRFLLQVVQLSPEFAGLFQHQLRAPQDIIF